MVSGEELYFLLRNYVFGLVAIAVLVHQYWKWRKFVNAVNLIPGAAEMPIIGNAIEVNMGGEDYRIDLMFAFMRDFDADRSLSRMWIGPIPLVNVLKASSAEIVLSSTKFIDKAKEYNFLHSWLGTGLLTSTGAKWHGRRKLLTGAFHFNILEDFMVVFNEQSHILSEKITHASATGEAFDIFPYITRCTLDIICESAMGKNIGAQSQSDSPYVKAIYKMSRIIMARQTKPWLRPNFLYYLSPAYREEKKCLEILHGFTNSVIAERKASFDTRQNKEVGGKKKRLAFLDLLLEASDEGKALSSSDIREEVNTFMFEGHDTTSAGIAWCFWLLGLHPKLQQRVQDELDDIFDGSDRPATMEDLTRMKFLECCIKEAQRLYPSVPFIARDLKDDLVIDDMRIPGGVTLLVMIMAIQRDPEMFDEPDMFIPDRFFPENSRDRNPYAFIPFSAGPRNCIGQRFAIMEEKVVISSLLRKFKVHSMENINRVTFHAELILRSKNGIRVVITPR